VSGSDLGSNAVTQRLADMGATVYQGHAAENIGNADAVVTSTAVQQDNPEVWRRAAARFLSCRAP
jgi:UDP-N-acetylmuramate--alanine ligase